MTDINPNEPKPIHLGPKYGAQFSDSSVVRAYRHRPPYPDELFVILARLLTDGPYAVLDAGCGSGDLTLGMLDHFPALERLDAVDVSAEMVAAGQKRAGDDDHRVHWQVSPIETGRLTPPYALITAGESLHWMDWSVVMPRFHHALLPGCFLAIAGRHERRSEWSDELLKIVQRYSTNRDFQPYNLIDELSARRLFTAVGQASTLPVTHTQSVDDHIESWHSRNGLSRDRMTSEAADNFDREARELLANGGHKTTVAFDVVGTVTWGLPAN